MVTWDNIMQELAQNLARVLAETPTRTIDITITKKANKFDYRKYADFKHAVDHILSLYNDRADFYLPDGTPVRIFEDEIQVGYELIPFYKIKKDYSNISDTVKKAIIDIYITISK